MKQEFVVEEEWGEFWKPRSAAGGAETDFFRVWISLKQKKRNKTVKIKLCWYILKHLLISNAKFAIKAAQKKCYNISRLLQNYNVKNKLLIYKL